MTFNSAHAFFSLEEDDNYDLNFPPADWALEAWWVELFPRTLLCSSSGVKYEVTYD